MTQPINYSDTTPAAPSGKVNVKWQGDAPSSDPTVVRNISAYVDPAGGGGGGGSSDSVEDISTWTLTNFVATGSTIVQNGGAGNPVTLVINNYPGLNWVWATRAFPSASFTATVKWRCVFWGANSQVFGLYLDGDGTKALSLEVLTQSPGSGARFRIETLNSPTSDNSTLVDHQFAMSLYDSGDLWCRVAYNVGGSGNMQFSYSFDGVNFINLGSPVAIGSFLTPTRVGFGGVSVGVALQMYAVVKSFTLS